MAFRATSFSSPVLIGVAVIAALIALPMYIVAAVFSYAGLTSAAATVHGGEQTTIRGALGSVRPLFWRYLGFVVLQGIVAALAPIAIAGAVIGLLVFLIPGVGAAAGLAIGFVIFIIAAAAFGIVVWLVVGYSIGLSVCVVEKKPAWQSLQRGWKLSEGTRGRILVMYLLVGALTIAVSMVAAIPFFIILIITTMAGNGAASSPAALAGAEIVRVIADFVLQVLLAPIPAIALVLFYYDQRIRKEGFDIEWMMERAGLTQSAAAPVDRTVVSASIAAPDTVEEP